MSNQIAKHEEKKPETINQRPAIRPPVDIYENTNEYLLIADLPGVGKENLVINLDGELLTIEGRVGDERGETPVEREYQLMDYRRSFELPNIVDRDKVSAELKHGVLTLHLPKVDEVKPRRIQVTVG
jgi:HSP20 family molecular chaperone IbpA